MIPQIEKTILSAYLISEPFNRTVTAHLKPEYFESEISKAIIKIALDYTTDNANPPTKIVLSTILEQTIGLNEKVFQSCLTILDDVYSEPSVLDIKNTSEEWLLNNTEQWCKERSVFNAIIKSLEILDGKVKEGKTVLDKSAIPDLMQKSLAISFDSSIGHNYGKEYKERYEFLHSPISKIPFSIPILNLITGGGIERKSLSAIMFEPHGGKSLCLASFAVDWARIGYNVLVITMEMAEMKIGQRVDANILNVDIGDLPKVSEKVYDRVFTEFNENPNNGEIIIREYPTNSASANHFRFLLQELKMKQGFVPDIVVVDYMGIVASAKYKTSENMYQVQKSVGEELRALAQEQNVAMFTAIQTNKGAFGKPDFGMESISESSGHAMTLDLLLAGISTPELLALGQVRFKQLKNRWGSIHDYETFLLRMDRKKMRLYDEMTANNQQNNYQQKKSDVDEVDEFDFTPRKSSRQINTDGFLV